MDGLEPLRSGAQSTNAANRSSICSKAEEKRSNYARSGMQPPELLHERLRRLAVENPREARKAFLRLFDSGGSALEQFLGNISSPADGRCGTSSPARCGTTGTRSASPPISSRGTRMKLMNLQNE